MDSDTSLYTSLINTFPFASRIKSNYIPSDAEIREIQSFLVKPTKEVDEMKAEIDRLDKEQSLLNRKYNLFHRQVIACRSLITIPRRLPDNVVRDTFYHSLPTDHNAHMSKYELPWDFTMISHHWRQIALSTPRLWSTIHIHLCNMPYSVLFNPPSDEERKVWHKKRAAASVRWLERSGALPLHISIFRNYELATPSPAFFDIYLQSIIPYAPHWKALFLQASWGSFSGLCTIEAADLHSLEALFLDFDIDPRYDSRNLSQEDIMSAWQHWGAFTAPSLQKLSIRQPTIDATKLDVNWSQLTHLDLGGPSTRWNSAMHSMSTLANVLQLCGHLLYCRLEIDVMQDATDSQIRPMHFPVLRRLSIQTQSDIVPFLEKLKLPVLQELHFHATGKEPNPTACLNPLFGLTTIQKLVIDSLYLSHESFLECLHHFSLLKSLTTKETPRPQKKFQRRDRNVRAEAEDRHSFRIDDGFLELLSSTLLPCLEELICENVSDVSTTGMKKFIQEKYDAHTRLPELAKMKQVVFQNAREASYDLKSLAFADDLREYISDGLKFEALDTSMHAFLDDLYCGPAPEYGSSAIQYADDWVE